MHPKRAEIVRKRADLRPLQRQAVRLIVEEPCASSWRRSQGVCGLIARLCRGGFTMTRHSSKLSKRQGARQRRSSSPKRY